MQQLAVVWVWAGPVHHSIKPILYLAKKMHHLAASSRKRKTSTRLWTDSQWMMLDVLSIYPFGSRPRIPCRLWTSPFAAWEPAKVVFSCRWSLWLFPCLASNRVRPKLWLCGIPRNWFRCWWRIFHFSDHPFKAAGAFKTWTKQLEKEHKSQDLGSVTRCKYCVHSALLCFPVFQLFLSNVWSSMC